MAGSKNPRKIYLSYTHRYRNWIFFFTINRLCGRLHVVPLLLCEKKVKFHYPSLCGCSQADQKARELWVRDCSRSLSMVCGLFSAPRANDCEMRPRHMCVITIKLYSRHNDHEAVMWLLCNHSVCQADEDWSKDQSKKLHLFATVCEIIFTFVSKFLLLGLPESKI